MLSACWGCTAGTAQNKAQPSHTAAVTHCSALLVKLSVHLTDSAYTPPPAMLVKDIRWFYRRDLLWWRGHIPCRAIAPSGRSNASEIYYLGMQTAGVVCHQFPLCYKDKFGVAGSTARAKNKQFPVCVPCASAGTRRKVHWICCRGAKAAAALWCMLSRCS